MKRRLILVLALLLSIPSFASIAWVQGASGCVSAPPPGITIHITPHAGDAIVISYGMTISGNPIFWGFTGSITDNQGNVYIRVTQSPIQYYDNGSYVGSQEFTWAALNVVGAATTITINPNGAYNCATVDEYSGVASIRAVDNLSFNSTAYFSGLSSVDSLSVPINGTETVYSVAYADTASETLTPTAGFTARESPTGTSATLVSFDKSFTGGTADNVVSASSMPGSLHVIAIALSPTPVASLVLQTAIGESYGDLDTTVSATYPYANQAGNLLTFSSRVYESSSCSAADTQLNTWVVFPFPNSGPADLIVGFALNAKPGANTVTLTCSAGGSGNSYDMTAQEYDYKAVAFTSSSWNQNQPGGSVNTGNVSAHTGDLLVSALWAGLVSSGANDVVSGLTPVGSSPGTWNYQKSSAGLRNSAGADTALADQVAGSPGSYSNTFTPNTSIDNLVGAILGFRLNYRHIAYVIHSK